LWVGNPSEKLRIGTLPIEESLAHKSSEMHSVSPSETCTTFSRTGALARAVHKANKCANARVCLMLCGAAGYRHLRLLPFHSAGAKPKRETTNGQTCVPLAQAKKSSQGKARLIPLKREAPQKRKTDPSRPVQDRPEACEGAKTPLRLPKRQCRPMQEPCRSEAQADLKATLRPTGEAPDDYPRRNAPSIPE
jgi:hypothetical protein